MIKPLEATEDDIQYVAENLWLRGKNELNLEDIEKIRECMRMLALKSENMTWTVRKDGLPVFVFGAYYNLIGDTFYTWFLATDRFQEIGLSATVFLKRFIAAEKKQYEGSKIELWTAVEHEDAERWFRLLGFELSYTVPDNPKIRCYEHIG